MLLVFPPSPRCPIEILLSFPDSSRLLLPFGCVIDIDAKFDVKLADVKEHCAYFEILLYIWRANDNAKFHIQPSSLKPDVSSLGYVIAQWYFEADSNLDSAIARPLQEWGHSCSSTGLFACEIWQMLAIITYLCHTLRALCAP